MGLTSTYRAFLSSHLQDLATIVRKADRTDMPVVNLRVRTPPRLHSCPRDTLTTDSAASSLKGEVLFSSWMSIFSGNGGTFNPSVPVYSFDGRDVMTEPAW